METLPFQSQKFFFYEAVLLEREDSLLFSPCHGELESHIWDNEKLMLFSRGLNSIREIVFM